MAQNGPQLELTLHSRGDTRRLGHALARCLQAGDLLLLEGELGAGKTFLARSVARGLGVPVEVRITSPTFDLVHELPARLPLLHVDLYRLDQSSELLELGLVDRIGADAVAIVEWGERFRRALGADGLGVELLRSGGPARRCVLRPHGPRSAALLERLRGELQARDLHGPRCRARVA